MNALNSDYHFIFGLRPDFGGKPFSLVHYVAVASCHLVNKPASMNFYYQHEPEGFWWDRAKPFLNLIRISPRIAIFGNPIRRVEHMADVVRLEILLECGGVYLDLDVISLKPLSPLQGYDTVLGEEYGVGLCNAVIMAHRGAPFLRRWLAAYRSFDSNGWNAHSVKVPYELWKRAPQEVHVLDHTKFFWPMYWPEHTHAFFSEANSCFCAESLCVHLWESITWPYIGHLTASDVLSGNSEFCSLIRPYVARYSGCS